MNLEQKIQNFAEKKTSLSTLEIETRKRDLRNFRAISALEGLATSEIDKKIFDLLVHKKISSNDYLSLCLEAIHEKI